MTPAMFARRSGLHYAKAAADAGSGCCSEGCGSGLYGAEIAELPETAVLASLGCGNPTAVAELREGETVLDLGSGARSTSCCRPAGSADRPGLRPGHDR